MAGGFIGAATSYAMAYAHWVAAGQPVRSTEDQQEIIQEHCIPCQFFRPNGPRCELCGCSLKLKSERLTWATTHCPANPPRW